MRQWHLICCRTHLHTYYMRVHICALLYVATKAPVLVNIHDHNFFLS